MTSKELKRWLASLGASFKAGKGSHLKVYLNGRQAVIPMHGKDIKPSTLAAIRRQLGLKD
jgi:mRNA interferase HicA